jgi:hypothetical protein
MNLHTLVDPATVHAPARQKLATAKARAADVEMQLGRLTHALLHDEGAVPAMLSALRGDAGHLFAAIQHENRSATEARALLLEHLDAIHRQLLKDERCELSVPDAEYLGGWASVR